MGAVATVGKLYALALNLQGRFHQYTKIGIMLKHGGGTQIFPNPWYSYYTKQVPKISFHWCVY